MKNKIFLLALIIPLTFSTATGKDVCDNLLLNYEVLLDRDDHYIQIQNNYYYSINYGVKKSLTITTGDITENRIRIPEINLISGDNQLRIYKEQEQIYRETIRYNPPDIRVSGLGSWEKIGDFYILKGLNELILGIKEAPVICAANGGLNKIRYYLNDLLIDSLTQMQAGGGTDIQINNFNGGINTLTFEIEGNFDGDILDKYPEYRELDTKEIMFFNIDFELPESLWKQDAFIKLSGNPAGGWFTGNGIIENSNYFNPKDADLGMNIITYHYPLDGEIVSVTREIDVKSLEFNINGDFWVCNNSKELNYNIEEKVFSGEFIYEWTIGAEVGSIVNNIGNNVTINWNENEGVSNTEILITATLKDDPTIKFTKESKVYFTGNKAYEKPVLDFGDTEYKLILCSNNTAYKYIWEVDGNGEKFETRNNFKYFNFIENYAEVTLLSEFGCKTKQIIYLPNSEIQANGFAQKSSDYVIYNISQSINVFPNPSHDYITVKTNNLKFDSWKIINEAGQIVKLGKIVNTNGNLLRINVSEMIEGMYILNLSDNQESNSCKFYIAK
jgi:hypothetical protein